VKELWNPCKLVKVHPHPIYLIVYTMASLPTVIQHFAL